MAVKASDSITLAKVNSITDAQAKAIEDTKAYFFYDDDGAHVTTNEGDATTGNNVLIDTEGMKIRDGETELASFGADTIQLGENAYSTRIECCKRTLIIGGYMDSSATGGEEGIPSAGITSAGDMSLDSGRTVSVYGVYGTSISAGRKNPVILIGAEEGGLIDMHVAGNGTISLRADTVTINGNPALTYGNTLLAHVNHGTTTGSSPKESTVTLSEALTNFHYVMIMNYSMSTRFSAIYPVDIVRSDSQNWFCTNPVNNPGYFAGFVYVSDTTLKIQSYREQVWIYGLCPV